MMYSSMGNHFKEDVQLCAECICFSRSAITKLGRTFHPTVPTSKGKLLKIRDRWSENKF